MTLNDGKGLYDKYGLIDEIKKRVRRTYTAPGVRRSQLLQEIEEMLNALKNGLRQEDAKIKAG